MKKYRVYYYITKVAYVDINADSIESAINSAGKISESEFIIGDPDWELDLSYTYEYNDEYLEDQ